MRVVLTGGLGVGKTTVLDLLRDRFTIVDEPARRLIAAHRADFIVDHLRTLG